MTESTALYSGLTALVVDDDPAVRILIRRMLERMGFDAEVAADGESALEAASRRTFDIVFTDLTMPGMDGMAFMREARSRGLEAPVVILTATDSVPQAVQAIKSGAFEFLVKPLRSEDLEKVVAGAMVGSGSLSLNIDVVEPVEPPPDRGPPPPPGSRLPARIGRYEVESRIGKGGMGVVYRCHDPFLTRTVAVKVLHVFTEVPEHAEEMIGRFRREAAAAGALAHPGIVAIHDLGYDENLGDWYIVMELIDGKGLNLVMNERKRLPADEAVSVGFQVSDALAYTHTHGIVHRDIKPSNVLLRRDGSVKLLDFGLAAVEGWDVTISGRVFGSPSYMAPERIRGKPGGPGADQFSLGVVLYETVTGKNPFEASTAEGRLTNVLKHRPPPVHEIDPALPPALSEVLDLMMAKEDTGRFAAMDDVADAFLMLGRDHGLELKRHND
jgi:CheY-like chemotaxis protein